jgi:hypothetical protein
MDVRLSFLAFAVQFGAILGVVASVGCLVHRIWDGCWLPTRQTWLGMSAVSALLSLVSTLTLGFTF